MISAPAPIVGEIEWFKRMAVPAPTSRKAGRKGRGGRAPAKDMNNQLWRVMGGSNTAVFKKIRNAGTHHPKQLAGQIAYLNGKADLVFGNGVDYDLGDAALSGGAVEDMIEQWSEGWKGQPKNGHTTHLVLSFPAYVTGEQASHVVEEWCEDMFQAVDAGMDEWSYYAAVHLDQPHHPHVHVIVNNRGLRNGDWFYMAEGHDFSYQNMKQRMVEISETHGVYLDATSRLERGIIEYAPRDAEYRRSIRMGLEPQGRAREGVALDAARATLIAYATQCRVMATIAENIEHPDLAENLRIAATDLEEARPIHRPGDTKMEIDLTQHPADIREALNAWALKNEEKIAALSVDDRKEVTDQLHKTLNHIETVLDRDYQVEWTPPAAQTPAFSQPFANTIIGDQDRLYERAEEYVDYIDVTAATIERDGINRRLRSGVPREDIGGYMPEITEEAQRQFEAYETNDGDLAAFREAGVLEHFVVTGERTPGWEGQFQAVEAAYADLSDGSLTDGVSALEHFSGFAESDGLDGSRLERRMVTGAINAREEEEWIVSDIVAVIENQGLDATNNEHVSKATAVVRSVQDTIAATMDEIHNRHHEVNHNELRSTALQVAREVEAYGVAAFASPEDEQQFMQQMRAAYGSVGIMEMANNHPELLNDITEDEAQQRAIIHTVLEHEAKHHELGLDQTMVREGLEHNNPRPGHEVDGHSL